MFVPAAKFVELESAWQFEMAKRQAKYIKDKFTYTVTGWNPDVDLFVDGPTRIVTHGTSKTHLPKRALASLILKEARGKLADGTSVQIFDKVQGSMRNPGMWNFQFTRKHAYLARSWLDSQLLPHLSNWFSDTENGENGSLTLKDLGAPVRQYTTPNSHTTKSDTSNVQGSSMDAYLQAASVFVPTSVSGPRQPSTKRGFRPKKLRGSRSYVEIVQEQQQNLQPSNFPALPATGTVQDPVVLTSSPSQQPSQVSGNVSPNSSLSSDTAKISELTTTVETLRTESEALREVNSQMEDRMTLHIQKVVAEQIAEAQAKWAASLDTQTEWMLKCAVAASTARTDTTANLLLARIDKIGEMVSQIANKDYTPDAVEVNAVEKATEAAISAALQQRPVPPASITIPPTPPANTTVSSQSSTATGSQSASASITSQDAALLLEQRTAMSDTNSRKRSAEEPSEDVLLSPPAAPPDPKRNTE